MFIIPVILLLLAKKYQTQDVVDGVCFYEERGLGTVRMGGGPEIECTMTSPTCKYNRSLNKPFYFRIWFQLLGAQWWISNPALRPGLRMLRPLESSHRL